MVGHDIMALERFDPDTRYIAYIKNKIPMAKKSAVCSYTADERAIIHSKLQVNPFVLMGLREEMPDKET